MNATSTARASADTQPMPVQPQSAGSAESAGSSPRSGASLEPAASDARQALIAIAAYYRAERRGFAAGCELDDWLAAEAEIAQQLRARANEHVSEPSQSRPRTDNEDNGGNQPDAPQVWNARPRG